MINYRSDVERLIKIYVEININGIIETATDNDIYMLLFIKNSDDNVCPVVTGVTVTIGKCLFYISVPTVVKH